MRIALRADAIGTLVSSQIRRHFGDFWRSEGGQMIRASDRGIKHETRSTKPEIRNKSEI
jgi:hypothetical protein